MEKEDLQMLLDTALIVSFGHSSKLVKIEKIIYQDEEDFTDPLFTINKIKSILLMDGKRNGVEGK